MDGSTSKLRKFNPKPAKKDITSIPFSKHLFCYYVGLQTAKNHQLCTINLIEVLCFVNAEPVEAQNI